MTEEPKKKLNQLTQSELSEIFTKLKDEGLLFRCNFAKISKHLLNDFLPVNPFAVPFETLKDEFLKHIEFDEKEVEASKEEAKDEGATKGKIDINKLAREESNQEIINATKDEDLFHRFICKSYFHLIKEPKEKLLEAFMDASRDINSIDETLIEIEKELNEIHTRKLASEIQEKDPILNYFKGHNERAKDEILNFLKTEIQDFALTNCYDNSLFSGWNLWLSRIPYNYNSKAYKPHYPNDLENKFGELLYPDFEALTKQYNEDKVAFGIYLTNFISENEVVYSIGNLIQYHHLLDVRKEIISEALKTYETGTEIMFASAVPTIIEGILHDICVLVGEDENILLQKGFQYKLDRLQNVLGVELHYEYYSFRFRLFRNKVAHGRLTQADVDELADLLLLDLYHICKLVSSDKLKLNTKRFVIDELNNNIIKPDFKYLIQYLLLDKIEIPPFYKLEKKIDEVEKLIVGSEFWGFLEKELETGGEPVKHAIHLILKILSSRKPFDKRCTKLFKKLGIKEADKELADHYFKYLISDF